MHVFCDGSFVVEFRAQYVWKPGMFMQYKDHYLDYTLDPTKLIMLCSSSHMKEPFVYMRCCGLYFKVFRWWNISRRGLYCYVSLMAWFWGSSPQFCEVDSVIYGCGLCGVGFHMCLIKFEDVGCEVLNKLLVSWRGCQVVDAYYNVYQRILVFVLLQIFGPFGCGDVFCGVWGDLENCVHILVCFQDFWGAVIAYDYGCVGGVVFGGHSCLMDNFHGGFIFPWVRYSGIHPF